jgi:hypothetical protein
MVAQCGGFLSLWSLGVVIYSSGVLWFIEFTVDVHMWCFVQYMVAECGGLISELFLVVMVYSC